MKHIYNHAEGILSFICVFIFMLSACVMLPLNSKDISNMILYIILIFTVMELSYGIKKNAGRLIRWGVPVIIVTGVLIYLFTMENVAEISEQLSRIARNYMQEWDSYYNGTKITGAGSEIHNVSKALNFVVFMSFFVVLWIACMTKKNIVMSVVPFAVLVLEHLVNISPDNISIFLLFAGVILSNAAGWKKADFVKVGEKKKAVSFLWVHTCLFVVVLCAVTKVAGAPSEESIHRQSERMKVIRNDVVKVVTGIDYEKAVFGEDVEAEKSDMAVEDGEVSMPDGLVTNGIITNEKPEYEDKPVMKITFNRKPKNNVYLKSYHGSIYQPDTCEFSDSTINDIKSKLMMAGYNADKTYEEIVFYAPGTFMYNVDNDKVSKYMQCLNGNIEYMSQQKDVLPMPYFAGVTQGTVEKKSDVLYVKSNLVKSINSLSDISIWDIDSDYSKWIKHIKKDSKEEWELWYESDVFSNNGYNIRYVPSEETYKLAEEMFDTVFESKENKKIQSMIDKMEIEHDNIGRAIDAKTGQRIDTKLDRIYNERTLLMAYEVKKWLADNMTYSLELDDVGIVYDPIDHFINTSKKGYCVHFASAAVTLLREMGIDSRYATGYVATVDAFEEKSDWFEATVLDSDAHAWVELYLQGIGWVPFEVTSGYSVEERLEMKENAVSTKAPATASPTTSPTISPAKDKGKKMNGVIWGQAVKSIMKVALIIVIALSFVVIIISVANIYRKRKQMAAAIKSKRTLYAVKTINRRIYKRLRTTGKILRLNVSDDAYEAALKKTYPAVSEKDWERYMEIVKSAAFSKRIIAEEEMEFCYNIYRKCF